MTLADYIGRWDAFDWTRANCVHFAAGWAGVDLSDVAMPAGPAGVRAAMRAAGVRSLADAVSSRLGPPIAPTLAQPGDIVLAGRALGICNGRTFAAPGAERGVVFLPMTDAEAAWRV